ncbi:enoyl-CoA hydratase/isomerase family protein [Hyphomonas sp.]|uniref:enoyl-CoA hydratase/isomerase family protein n=1 Tax=Hyphomonas sp. TaxID=87 RepID=UPI0037C19822
MLEFNALEFSREQAIAIIRLARPAAGNALDLDLARELARAARECSEDDSVKAVLLTGQGRMFCVGGDLKAFSASGDRVPDVVQAVAEHLHAAIQSFRKMPAPMVVAVNGTAAGAGFSLTMCGDIVLAARSSKFTMAYTAAGLTPDGGASYFLPRLVGVRRAQELIYLNRVLSADEAKSWGLVTEVVEDEQLGAAAMATARRLADGSRSAQAGAKRLLSETDSRDLAAHMALEAAEVERAAGTPDGREGIEAFLNKRPARFL